MIKPGSLVRLNPKYYSITYKVRSERELVGLVIKSEHDFYPGVLISHNSQNRHYVLWGNETYSYEPDGALVEVVVSDD